MAHKKGFNNYKIIEEYVIIYLEKRTGEIFETYIDLEDLDKIKKLGLHWHVAWCNTTQSYYAHATEYLGIFNGKAKYKIHGLHKEVMNETSHQIDHKNHDTLDNRKYNLNIVTKHENVINRRGANPNNTTSGERNVCWVKGQQKWLVQLQVDGKNTCFGRFDYEDLDKAILLAEEMRNILYNKIYNPNI